MKPVGKRSIKKHSCPQTSMPPQTFHKHRLVGIQPERVTNVSNTDYPGHYPQGDFSWNLSKFKQVRRGPYSFSVFVY